MNKCACGERNTNECEEECGTDCDLGNNEKYVKVSQVNLPAPVAMVQMRCRGGAWREVQPTKTEPTPELRADYLMKAHPGVYEVRRLYTAAPAPVAQPLTHEQVKTAADHLWLSGAGLLTFEAGVRFAERAHGIKATGQENNNGKVPRV